jgi:hypothetical protein
MDANLLYLLVYFHKDWPAIVEFEENRNKFTFPKDCWPMSAKLKFRFDMRKFYK